MISRHQNKALLWIIWMSLLGLLTPNIPPLMAQVIDTTSTSGEVIERHMADVTLSMTYSGAQFGVMAVNHREDRLAGMDPLGNRIIEFDIETGAVTRQYNGLTGSRMMYSADDRLLVFMRSDANLVVLDAETFVILNEIPITLAQEFIFAEGLLVLTDRAYLMLNNYPDPMILVAYDLAAGTEIARIMPFPGPTTTTHSLQQVVNEEGVVQIGIAGALEDYTPFFKVFDAELNELSNTRSRYMNSVVVGERVISTSLKRIEESTYINESFVQSGLGEPAARIATDMCVRGGAGYRFSVDAATRIASATTAPSCPTYLLDVPGTRILYEIPAEQGVLESYLSRAGDAWFVMRETGIDRYDIALTQEVLLLDDAPRLPFNTLADCEAITLAQTTVEALDSVVFLGMNVPIIDRLATIQYEGSDVVSPLIIAENEGQAIAYIPPNPDDPFTDHTATITLLADATPYDFNNCLPITIVVKGLPAGEVGAYQATNEALEAYLRHLIALAGTTPEALQGTGDPLSPDQASLAIAWQAYVSLVDIPTNEADISLLDAISSKLNLLANLRNLQAMVTEPIVPVSLAAQLRPAQYASTQLIPAQQDRITLTAAEMVDYFERGYEASYALNGDVFKQGWDGATNTAAILSLSPKTAAIGGKIGLVTYSAQLPFKIASALLPSEITRVTFDHTRIIENEDDLRGGTWRNVMVTARSGILPTTPLLLDGLLNTTGTFTSLIPPKVGAIVGKSNEFCASGNCYADAPIGPITYVADFSDPDYHTAEVRVNPDIAIEIDNEEALHYRAISAGTSMLQIKTIGLRTLKGRIIGINDAPVTVNAIEVLVTPRDQRVNAGDEVCVTIRVNNAEIKSVDVTITGTDGTLFDQALTGAETQEVCVTAPEIEDLQWGTWFLCDVEPSILPEGYFISVVSTSEQGARSGRIPPRTAEASFAVQTQRTDLPPRPPRPSDCAETPVTVPATGMECVYNGQPQAGSWSMVFYPENLTSTCPSFLVDGLANQLPAITSNGQIYIPDGQDFGDILQSSFINPTNSVTDGFVVSRSLNECSYTATMLIPDVAVIQYRFDIAPTVINGGMRLDLPSPDGGRCDILVPFIMYYEGVSDASAP